MVLVFICTWSSTVVINKKSLEFQFSNMLDTPLLKQLENWKFHIFKKIQTTSGDVSSETEFCQYERKIANRLGYADVTLTRFHRDSIGNYSLKSTTPLAQFSFWGCTVNLLTNISGIFTHWAFGTYTIFRPNCCFGLYAVRFTSSYWYTNFWISVSFTWYINLN